MNIDLFNYRRRDASVTHVGHTPMGGRNPIRLQSMTTTPTTDTEASVKQSAAIAAAGGEYVRLTTQGVREAENMANIRCALHEQGVTVPLVADVHFNPHVAEVAAEHVEKVRINPGNYTDPARQFRSLSYTDEEYAAEIDKIEKRLVPLLDICREHHTALRIGVNHGSLSDRIMSRYGDTPEGIVESCMEFLRICRKHDFHDIVISIKASNTVVMVLSVRLLVERMDAEDMHYPLHLGVTEAGEGEDGRIRSAVGIGALLADGLGDTLRVSLSEAPEREIPVARLLRDHLTARQGHAPIPGTAAHDYCYTRPERRPTTAVGNIGGSQVPVVICTAAEYDASAALHPDYLYVGRKLPSQRMEGTGYIVDFDVWDGTPNTYPIFSHQALPFVGMVQAERKFVVLEYGCPSEEYIACLKAHPEVVVVALSRHQNPLGEWRALTHELWRTGLTNPVIPCRAYRHGHDEVEAMQIETAADMGVMFIDALADGIWLMNEGDIPAETITNTAFAILQAARCRVSATEYISCPGCGRTLYDLQQTIAQVKAATRHLSGLKIAIMGCVVNGPGEMADADYGYVGAARGRISLYRRKECIEKNIPESEAVERLLALIEADRQAR